MPDLNIKITADAQQAQANLNQLTTSIVKFAQQLQNTTPQQVALARSFAEVQQQFNAGKITLEEARAKMAALATEAGKLGGQLEASGGSTKSFGLSFTDLKSALDLAKTAAQTAGQVFKQAFDFGLLGAQVTQTQESFDNLIQVVGASPDLFNQLKQASGGTIPNLKLMSATSTLLAGTQGDLAKALANSTPQLLEIARAANKLNPSLGDTAYLYDSLALGIKRASPMILDNLGLTIKLGAANEAMAASLGKSVDQLTAAEKQQALLNATLEAGDVLIQQVGGSVDSAVDPFNRLQASTENLKNSLAQGLAPALANAADGANLLLTWNQQLNDVMAQHNAEVANTSTTYADYIAEMERAAQAAGMQLVVTDELTDAEGRTMGAVIGLTEAQWNANQATQAVAESTVTWSENTFYAQQAQEGIYNAVTANTGALYALQAANDSLAGSLDYTKQVSSLLNDVLIVQGDTYSENNQRVLDYLLAVGEITKAEYADAVAKNKQVKALETLNAALDGNMITMEQWQDIMEDGKITTEELTGAVTTLWGTFLENTLDVAASDAEEMAQAMGDVYDATNDVSESFGPVYDLMLKTGKGLEMLTEDAGPLQGTLSNLAVSGADAALAVDDLATAAQNAAGDYEINIKVNVTGDPIPNVGGYGNGAPTGPTTPTASQRVGGEMPLPGDMGDTDWQAVFMSLTNEQQRAVQDMVGDSMYEADYARAITKVLKKGDLTDLARKLGGRGGRTLPRGDGGGGAHPMPTSGGFAVADGAGNVIYANTLVIYATNAELNAENGGDNFAMFSQKVGA